MKCASFSQILGRGFHHLIIAPGSRLLSSAVRSYLKLISLADAGAPSGRNYYEKARTLKSLSDEVIEAIATLSRMMLDKGGPSSWRKN
jgi:predicted metal-binding protein